MSGGSKIDKPFILEKFHPLPIDKYITFHPFTKGAKNYDLYEDLIGLIHPILAQNGITIVQVGTQGDRPFNGCLNIVGQTNLGQLAYVIKNSLLHFGADSLPVHLSGHYDVPIVALYSNNYKECVGPYWGTKEKQILLEPDRNGAKPNFSLDEHPKTINRIKPEVIAQSICKLLNLPFSYPFETLFQGDYYHNKLVEMVPDSNINIQGLGIDGIIVRMDFLFNEQILANQLNICPCSITTNKPISIELLSNLRPRIRELIYIIDENHSPEFVEKINKLAINYHLVTYLDDEKLNPIKLDYLDYKIIHQKRIFDPYSNKILKNVFWPNLYYKSSKFILSEGKVYPSYCAWLNKTPIPSISPVENPIIDSQDFWKESDNFMFLKKV